MNLKEIHKIYFLGIGGIGMSALARYFNFFGIEVHGYDRNTSDLTKELESEGMVVHYEENLDLIPKDINFVVYTPAIPKENIEFQYFLKNNTKLFKRSQILGEIAKNYYTIAVAGTHGKTTITTMITHILVESGKKVLSFMGGISKNFNSNLVLNKEADVLIVEADEYDKSFLTLNPNIAVISSIDADHLDVYGNYSNLENTFFEFINNIKQDGLLFSESNINIPEEWKFKAHSYSATNTAIHYISNHYQKGFQQTFDIKGLDRWDNITLNIPGKHNAENALVAAMVARSINCDFKEISNALSTFLGVKRRFDIRIHNEKVNFIDDYAHHPKEISACISAVRSSLPDKRIIGIFQPHLFSRTRDLANEFATCFEGIDHLILLDIYPAREKPIEGINSKWLLDQITIPNKELGSFTNVIDRLEQLQAQVILTMGAGNIDSLIPLIENKFGASK